MIKKSYRLDDESYAKLANSLRVLSAEAVERANSGHPGMPMGFADVATILFSEFLHFNPTDAKWLNRDRFILSAGHGSMLLYSLLYFTNYPDVSLQDIKNFRQINSNTAGHPEYGFLSGIETTTGPLGQGFANAVGMAVAERRTKERLGGEIIDHKIYCVVGDGCLMEGISHEAASLAGHLGLDNLIVLFDDNGISIDGSTDLTISDDTEKRFESYGWKYLKADGHDYTSIRSALTEAQNIDKPVMIAFKTNIGQGASESKCGSESVHGAPLGAYELGRLKENNENILGEENFTFTDEVMKKWRDIGANSCDIYEAWQDKISKLSGAQKIEYENITNHDNTKEFTHIIASLKQEYLENKPSQASRKSSGQVLAKLLDNNPELIGGSADLSTSNETITKSSKKFDKTSAGNYIHYGIREHAMGAIMNGISLYANYIPYGGSFLIFSDYMRPAIRLAALMQIQTIYVMTHDSIGLGEDGPTHQPVEHLSSLRAIPNLNVMRPADAVETAECWEIALTQKRTPSLLALSRQNLPLIRNADHGENNLSIKGAYIIHDAINADVHIFSSGSEVHIAIEAAHMLEKDNINVRVISVPSMELFFMQDKEYVDKLLGTDVTRVAVEAGISQSWDKILGHSGIFIGMADFGSSGKYQDLYNFYGITAENICTQILNRLNDENSN